MTPWAIFLVAFLMGSIPFGFIAGKLHGKDLRKVGSGNIGATNVLRELGPVTGITVLILDILKGYLPTLYASLHYPPDTSGAASGTFVSGGWMVVSTGLWAVLGHIYSPFVRFRGGKGVATSLGVLIALSPMVAGLTLLVFAAAYGATLYVSLGSILGAVAQAILFCILPFSLAYRVFSVIVAAFVIFRHRGNIKRILSGTETKTHLRKPRPPAE